MYPEDNEYTATKAMINQSLLCKIQQKKHRTSISFQDQQGIRVRRESAVDGTYCGNDGTNVYRKKMTNKKPRIIATCNN